MTLKELLPSAYQQAAVDQIIWHDFTTQEAVSAFCNISPRAADGVFGALKYKRLVNNFLIHPTCNGYRFTSFACQLLNLKRSSSRPRGEQAWIFRLGRLMDCSRRQILPYSPDSLRDSYPELTDFLDQAGRYVPGVEIELTVLHVDHGGSADRIFSKVNEIASRYLKHSEARRLVWSGRLGVRILTASIGKAEAIMQRIARASSEPLCRVEIDAVEALQPLFIGRVRNG